MNLFLVTASQTFGPWETIGIAVFLSILVFTIVYLFIAMLKHEEEWEAFYRWKEEEEKKERKRKEQEYGYCYGGGYW